MDEDRQTHVHINEPTYVGLTSSSDLTGEEEEEKEQNSVHNISSFHSESYHNFDSLAEVEPAKKLVQKSILKFDVGLKPQLQTTILREYKRASSIKLLKRQSRDIRQSIRLSLKQRQSEGVIVRQQSLLDIESTIQKLDENEHDNMKYLAVQQVGIQLLSGISMLANEHRCPYEPFANMEMPHNFFSWNLDDCLARFEMSMVWYNLLQKQLSPSCLETRKISTDFAELKRLVNLILEGYLQKDIEMYEVLMVLNLADDYINLEDTLTRELQRNNETYTTQLYRKIAFTFIRRVSEVNRGTSEDNSADDGIISPIILRYLMRYQASVEDQHQIQADMKYKDLEDNMRKILTRQQSEEYCSQSTMNYYYNENATLRQKLQMFSKKYEKDFERVMSQNVYLRLTSKKLVTQKNFLTEQIQRFHEEIKEIKLAKLAEEEAELAQQLAETEAEAKHLYDLKMAKRRKRLEAIRNRKMMLNQSMNKSKARKISQDET